MSCITEKTTRLTFGCIFAIIFLFLSIGGQARATVIHVPADSLTIQSAVSGAADGDTVLVAPGTYRGEGNRDIIFFNMDITLLSEAGADSTVIDCDTTGRAFYIDQCHHNRIEISGFRVVNGKGDDGGAVYCRNSDPLFSRCVFENNLSLDDGGAFYLYDSNPSFVSVSFLDNVSGDDGGALCCNNADPFFSDCIFTGNSAVDNGGAVRAYYSDASFRACLFNRNHTGSAGGSLSYYCASGAEIDSSTFTENSADGDGGAVSCYYSHPSIRGSFFIENSAGDDGGAVSCDNSDPPVTQTVFTSNSAAGDGGGMFLYGSYPTLTNCSFNGNTSECAGGGIYVRFSGPVLESCAFSGNYGASDGGGIYCNSSSPFVQGCCITDNETCGSGGGVCITSADPPEFVNCKILRNYAKYHGGGVYVNNSNPLFTDCLVNDNSCDEYGGGFSCWYGVSLSATGCEVSGNSAAWYGGGLYVNSTAPDFTECVFSENSSILGAGLHLTSSEAVIGNCTISGNSASTDGGGFYVDGGSNPSVSDCLITENHAVRWGGGFRFYHSTGTIEKSEVSGNMSKYGAGIRLDSSNTTLTNCFITENEAEWWGGGLLFSESSPSVTHCTIAGNSAGINGAGLYNYDSEPVFVNSILWNEEDVSIYTEWKTPIITYSDVYGGWEGEGNIESYPVFIGGGNYRLLPGSPCIDSGTDAGIYEDRDGDERPFGAGFDMGADEYLPGLLAMLADYPPSVVQGGVLTFSAGVSNQGEEEAVFDEVSLEISGPASTSIGIYAGGDYSLAPEDSVSTGMSLTVGGSVSVGVYTVTLAVQSQGTRVASDSFDVEVVAP